MPTIVLFGAGGMLGHALQQVLPKQNLHAFSHHDLDITSAAAVTEALNRIRPDYVINAAAYTKVDDCESHQESALRINGQAPGIIAAAAKQVGACLVHYSTDYVFSGEQANGYREADLPRQPVNYYGHSKLVGEKAIQASGASYYLIRTAWLYGQHGPNFVDTMLNLAKTNSSLRIVDDQHGSPTYTLDLAAATLQFLSGRLPFGVYHVTNSGDCSWYDFAKEIFKLKGIDIVVEPCTSAEFPRPARRPSYSILLNTKLPPLPTWQAALERYLSDRTK